MKNKFKPILFSTDMVKAIISGRKTQTRRVVKFPKDFDGKNIYQNGQFGLKYSSNEFEGCVHRLYPKYEIGDIIWVRELHYRYGKWVKNGTTKKGKQKWLFAPGKQFTEVRYFDNPPNKLEKNSNRSIGWYKRSSLFMPKEACRLFLEVTDIRAERLQDISFENAAAEGIEQGDNGYYKNYLSPDWSEFGETAIDSFTSLWDKINKNWNENPYVWVITFKVVDRPEGFIN